MCFLQGFFLPPVLIVPPAPFLTSWPLGGSTFVSRTVGFCTIRGRVEPPDVFVCRRWCFWQEVAVWGSLVSVDGLRL